MIALMFSSIDYIGSYNKVGSILPIEDFPAINIIEPYLMSHFIGAVPSIKRFL